MRHLILFLVVFGLFSCEDDSTFTPMDARTIPSVTEIADTLEIDIPEFHDIDLDLDTITFLALGDSYTIGSGVKKDARWPNQLVEKLNMLGINIELTDIVAGKGWRSDNLIKIIEDRNLEPKYDLISLLIGVNNQYQGSPFEVFQKDFMQLLSMSLEKAKSRSSVFVISIPDYGVTPFGDYNKEVIGKEIDMYNDWIKEACTNNNIKFYNVTEISRKAENDLNLLAADLLHPSEKMYSLWVDEIIADLPKVLLP